ncbi:MAG TPA: tetratricopeptide repeat protein [Rhizomicrobium sp.]|nr:tetratricopeptide repeat protein [Rhizomicrobium sp.]
MSAIKQLRRQAAEHMAARRLNEAMAAYGEVLARAPRDVDALHSLGMLKLQTGATEEGRQLLEKAVTLDPGCAEARLHLGMALQNLGRRDDAAAAYGAAIALKPDYAEALFQLGLLQRQLGRLPEALSCFQRCAVLAPREPHVFLQRAELHFLLNDFAPALADFELVLVLQREANAAGRPTPAIKLASLLFNRAVALENLGRFDEALAAYEQLVAMAPGNPDAWTNRGNLLRQEARLGDAEASYRRALALDPGHIVARINRGTVRGMLGKESEALADWRKLLELAPHDRNVLGGLLSSAGALCDWDTIDALRPRLEAEIPDGRALVAPFPMALSFSDPKLLHTAISRFRRESLPPAGPRPALRADLDSGGGRIRLAYLSADFFTHATAHLMADLFERHDRARFEVIGISYGAESPDPVRERLKKAFDRFIDVQTLPDAKVAALLRQMQVDIAVDLKGYTLWSRSQIMAYGCAPVQVSYLGWPGTVGPDLCDYVLADPVVLPHDQQPYWDEKIVHLPDTYQVNDPSRPHDPPMTRGEAGLPENTFIFASFNSHRKIRRGNFDVWMRLLAAVPGSVLWLLDDSANERLREHARMRGVDPARLIFAPRMDSRLHLQRLPNADLMLDNLPYGAHTTASDALWMGVPIVTCQGTAFAGRVGASLLTAISCPELITHSMAEYEALALELARDGERLAALRRKLADNRLTAPLFDAARFCRHIEQAYVTMMEIARAGEAPRPFDVPVIE